MASILGWWVTVPTSRRIRAVVATATAAAVAPGLAGLSVFVSAPAAAATAQAPAPVVNLSPAVSINAVAATSTSRAGVPFPLNESPMDTFINFQLLPVGSLAGYGWTRTQISGVLPTVKDFGAGGRMVQDLSTGTAAAAAYFTKQLSDAAQISHFRGACEIVSNTSATFDVPLWQYFMNEGAHDGHLQRSSMHWVGNRTGYMLQKYSTAEGGATTLYTVNYPSPPGGAVQKITITLDIAAQTVTIVGGDGVTRVHGPNSLLVQWPGLYGCIEIYDVNPSVDDTRWLYGGFDSIVRKATAVAAPAARATAAAGVPAQPPPAAPAATATASAGVPTVNALSTPVAPVATATASAPAPLINAGSLTPPPADATAAAGVPSVATGASIAAVSAPAVAAAGVPSIAINASVTAVAATATAAAGVPTTVGVVKASFSDTFNRADAATLGASWTARSNNLKIVSNVAVPDTLSAFCADSYNTDFNTDNHKVSATINAAPGTELLMLWLRSNNTDSQIYAYCQTGAQWIIYSKASTYVGSLTTPTQRAITAGAVSFTAADVISFEASGAGASAVFDLKKNGSSVLQFADTGSAIPTGATHRGWAIGYYAAAAGHGIDSVTAVDL